MARKDNAETSAEGTENATTKATEEKKDNRSIVLTVPEGDVSGLSGEVKRVDFIRALWKSGDFTRGEIAKRVSELQGVTVPYQIVFQATKGQGEGKMAQRGTKSDETSAEAPTEEAASE